MSGTMREDLYARQDLVDEDIAQFRASNRPFTPTTSTARIKSWTISPQNSTLPDSRRPSLRRVGQIPVVVCVVALYDNLHTTVTQLFHFYCILLLTYTRVHTHPCNINSLSRRTLWLLHRSHYKIF